MPRPDFERETDRSITVRAHESRESTYSVDVEGGPTFESAIINIGGRAAALSPPASLELGGGDTTLVIRGYEDGRADDGVQIAIGFQSTAIV